LASSVPFPRVDSFLLKRRESLGKGEVAELQTIKVLTTTVSGKSVVKQTDVEIF